MTREQAEELYNTIHKDFVVHWKDDFKQMTARKMFCLFNVVYFEEVYEHEIESERPLTYIRTFSGESFFAEVSFPRFKLMHKKAFMIKVLGPESSQGLKFKKGDPDFPDEEPPMFTFYQL